jgi:hypothetical protein
MPPIRRSQIPTSGDHSEIRSVDSAARSRAPSEPELTPIAPPPSAATPSRSAPPSRRDSSLPLSRDERIEQKLREAERLLRELGSNDSRGRLLQAAAMRRDEGLLDAILASLTPSGG